MSSILEAKIPFLHRVWQESSTKDAHGNKTGQFADPVQRFAIQIYPANATISRSDFVSPTVVARTETDIFIDVDDASIFGERDRVVLEGKDFKVQGQPEFNTRDLLPIKGYEDIVPDTIYVKRVT